jgi:hypothetical protein
VVLDGAAEIQVCEIDPWVLIESRQDWTARRLL